MLHCLVLFEIIFIKIIGKNIKEGLKRLKLRDFQKSCNFSSVLNDGNKTK